MINCMEKSKKLLLSKKVSVFASKKSKKLQLKY